MEAQGETAYAGDAASVEWQAGDTGDAIAVYNSDVGDMKAPLLNAAGYFIAFLTGVSKTVQDPGPNDLLVVL